MAYVLIFLQGLKYFFSGTRQNVQHDKNTVGQLIITVRQNVQCNKHSIRQKTITFAAFLNVRKWTQKLKNTC